VSSILTSVAQSLDLVVCHEAVAPIILGSLAASQARLLAGGVETIAFGPLSHEARQRWQAPGPSWTYVGQVSKVKPLLRIDFDQPPLYGMTPSAVPCVSKIGIGFRPGEHLIGTVFASQPAEVVP
jgi:hypothetical protein